MYDSPQCFPNQQMKANRKQTGVELAASEPEWNKPQANRNGANRKQTGVELTASEPE